jgi:hypothetical protein
LGYSILEAEFKAYGDIFLQQDAGEACRLVPVRSLYRRLEPLRLCDRLDCCCSTKIKNNRVREREDTVVFIGHFGVGFGAKAAAPKTSLGTLFLAAQFVDLLWPSLLLVGLEKVVIAPGITRVTPLDFTSYPISHSLVAALVWGTLFAAAYYLLRRYPKGAWICGAAVLSHWVLDALVHRPDLPLVPGCAVRIGLGLWNSLPATLIVELGIFAAGVWLYVRTTRALDRVGSVALWSLVGFLLIMYLGNLFGPPPPSATAIAWAGQAQWLLVIWAFWIDRHRAVGTSTKD